MNFFKKYSFLIIAVLSLFNAFIWNELNVSNIEKLNIENLLRNNETIITSDDASYIVPPQNFIHKGVWKTNEKSNQSFYFRSPGYGIWYGLFYFLFQNTNYLLILKFCQLLLFAISVYFLAKSVFLITNSNLISNIVAILYGVLPIGIGFLYYTLTESISPAILIFFIYHLFVVNYNLKWKRNLIYTILLGAYLVLLGPILGIFLIPFLYVLYVKFKHYLFFKRILMISLLSFLLLLPTLLWEIRKITINKEYPGLHPVYCIDNKNEFRPQHQALWLLVNKWGTRGDDFHQLIRELNTNVSINELINNKNSKYHIVFNKEISSLLNEKTVKKLLTLYKSAINEMDSMRSNKLDIQSVLKTEVDATIYIDSIRKVFVNNNFVKAYIVSPLIYLKQLIFHSNLSLYIYQVTYRGFWLMEIVRFFCFLIMTISVFSLLSVLFIQKSFIIKLIMYCVPLLYLIFICFVFRGVEERYILPFLPMLIITLVFFGEFVYKIIKNIFLKN